MVTVSVPCGEHFGLGQGGEGGEPGRLGEVMSKNGVGVVRLLTGEGGVGALSGTTVSGSGTREMEPSGRGCGGAGVSRSLAR